MSRRKLGEEGEDSSSDPYNSSYDARILRNAGCGYEEDKAQK